ncbi:sigma-70 family RNA polymerase sigma factor [Alistipes putredinis]|uniref:sigma-70 family RNA polymerase sigma factor n=1 Tax=Alistipes putredinis TaxID=28117 RepID=UPI003AB4EDAD
MAEPRKAGCGQIHPQLPFRAGQTRDIQLLPHQEPHVHDPKGGYRADRKQGGGGNLPSRNEIEEKLDLAETAEQVETIVGKMPPQRQQIFRMSRFEHMPSREIAEQLNLSVRTVDKHLELALKELRKYLNIIPAIIVFLDILP